MGLSDDTIYIDVPGATQEQVDCLNASAELERIYFRDVSRAMALKTDKMLFSPIDVRANVNRAGMCLYTRTLPQGVKS